MHQCLQSQLEYIFGWVCWSMLTTMQYVVNLWTQHSKPKQMYRNTYNLCHSSLDLIQGCILHDVKNASQSWDDKWCHQEWHQRVGQQMAPRTNCNPGNWKNQRVLSLQFHVDSSMYERHSKITIPMTEVISCSLLHAQWHRRVKSNEVLTSKLHHPNQPSEWTAWDPSLELDWWHNHSWSQKRFPELPQRVQCREVGDQEAHVHYSHLWLLIQGTSR